MTVEELYSILEELIEDGHGADVVRIAHQPHWPLAHNLRGCVGYQELANARQHEDDEEDYDGVGQEMDFEPDEFGPTLWLVAEEGNCREHPYADKLLWSIV